MGRSGVEYSSKTENIFTNSITDMQPSTSPPVLERVFESISSSLPSCCTPPCSHSWDRVPAKTDNQEFVPSAHSWRQVWSNLAMFMLTVTWILSMMEVSH